MASETDCSTRSGSLTVNSILSDLARGSRCQSPVVDRSQADVRKPLWRAKKIPVRDASSLSRGRYLEMIPTMQQTACVRRLGYVPGDHSSRTSPPARSKPYKPRSTMRHVQYEMRR